MAVACLTVGEISVYMKMTWFGFTPPTAVLCALVASAALPAAAQAPPTLILTQKDNGTTVSAWLEQPIEINLPANPSTGFSWYLVEAVGNSVASNGPAVFTPGSPGVGGPGTMSLPFLAVNVGLTALSFAYDQPWNPQNPLTNYAVAINVTAMTPSLSVTLDGDNVVLTWTTNSSGFFLEGTTSLDPPHWAALNVAPMPDGPNYAVTLGHSGVALYFRLHKL